MHIDYRSQVRPALNTVTLHSQCGRPAVPVTEFQFACPYLTRQGLLQAGLSVPHPVTHIFCGTACGGGNQQYQYSQSTSGRNGLLHGEFRSGITENFVLSWHSHTQATLLVRYTALATALSSAFLKVTN